MLISLLLWGLLVLACCGAAVSAIHLIRFIDGKEIVVAIRFSEFRMVRGDEAKKYVNVPSCRCPHVQLGQSCYFSTFCDQTSSRSEGNKLFREVRVLSPPFRPKLVEKPQ